MPENIAQVEFFLYEWTDEKDMRREVMDRVLDQARIKLVVRIFDTRGVLTQQAVKSAAIRNKSRTFNEQLPIDFLSLSRLRRWWIDLRSKSLASQSLAAAEDVLKLSLQELEYTIRNEGVIATETYPGSPFRLVRHKELYELLETARRAHSAWVFVFRPTELLANKVTLVAHTI